MSKSKGNTIAPDDVIARYGADTLRLYILFAAPPELAMEWSESGIEGPHRFLQRVWRLVDRHAEAFAREPRVPLSAELPSGREGAAAQAAPDRSTASRATSRSASSSTPRWRRSWSSSTRSTASRRSVAAGPGRAALREALETLVLLLNPFTPHVCEELWRRSATPRASCASRGPVFDAAAAREDEVELAVQVNGKVRGRVVVPRDAGEDQIRARALAEPRVAEHVLGKQMVKFVVVPGRLVSMVVK